MLGGAGTGKTQIILRFIKEMFKDDPTVGTINSAFTKDQVDNLNKAVGDDSNSITLSELLKRVNDFNPDKIKFNEEKFHFVYTDDEGKEVWDINDDSIGISKEHKILFIDEISFANEVMLQALDKWAIKNDFIIMACGDDKQPGAYLTRKDENGDSITTENGITDCYF